MILDMFKLCNVTNVGYATNLFFHSRGVLNVLLVSKLEMKIIRTGCMIFILFKGNCCYCM